MLELAADGAIDGLRIDHPDGLYDPARYFRRLQEGYARRVGAALPADATAARAALRRGREDHRAARALPEDWAIHGTTGYRFANLVNGLFVDTGARARLDRAWRAFVRDEAVDFERGGLPRASARSCAARWPAS